MSKIKRYLTTFWALLMVIVLGQIGFGLPGLGNLGGLLGGLGGAQRRAPANVFKKALSHKDWWDTDLESEASKIAVKAGVWATIGRYQVPAQQAIRFGFGSAAFPDNQGYMHMAVYDDTATDSVLMEGAIRLIQRNYHGIITLVVAEFRSEQLRGSVSDRSMQIALPEQAQFPKVVEDSYLELQFNTDADGNLIDAAIGESLAKDVWNIPVTIYQ